MRQMMDKVMMMVHLIIVGRYFSWLQRSSSNWSLKYSPEIERIRTSFHVMVNQSLVFMAKHAQFSGHIQFEITSCSMQSHIRSKHAIYFLCSKNPAELSILRNECVALPLSQSMKMDNSINRAKSRWSIYYSNSTQNWRIFSYYRLSKLISWEIVFMAQKNGLLAG